MKSYLDVDSFREVIDSLLRNKSRSLLTGFGIFWGLFMLLFLIGGGNGLQQIMSANFEGFATNMAVVCSSNTSKPYKGFHEGRYWDLHFKDVERLRILVPELDVVTPEISYWGEGTVVRGENKYSDFVIKGVEPVYSEIEAPRLKYGRFINEADNLHERKVCVIGRDLYEALFPEGGDPCGQFILMKSIYVQVVGVDMSSGNMNINGSARQSLTIPISVAQKLYNTGTLVHIICMTAKKGIKMSSIENRIREVVARENIFDPQDREAMMFFNIEDIFQIAENLRIGLSALIWLVGLGTILAGAIGVSNIMMVTVKERTVEIGVRRAIGAMPYEILMQIVMESITLTVLAGSFGILLAVLVLQGIEMGVHDGTVFQMDFWMAIGALAALALLGIIAGMAPALRAMKIRPVDAMRDE